MRVSFWHHTADRQPEKSGYYLAYRGWGMGGKGDYDHDHGYLYYYKKTDTWYSHESDVRASFPDTAIVYYWTDATPDKWTDQDPPVSMRNLSKQEMHVAEKEALAELIEAMKRYETVKALCAKS